MTGIGSSLLKSYHAGDSLTTGESIKAKCADCTGNYADGRESCEMPECPLFPFMPYNPNRIRRTNPSRLGMRPGEKNSSEICVESDVDE